jgi:tetratricopeptide (TPR) repeat protein
VANSGNATSSSGGFSNTGYVGNVAIQQPPKAPPEWPLRIGQVPALASAFQPRPGLRDQMAEARAASTRTDNTDSADSRAGDGGGAGGVVLTQVLSGGGGVGKSQLAASYAGQAVRDRTDLVVWADASAPGAVIAAYAQAAARVQAPGVTGQLGDAEADARAFLDWAAATSRSWLVVLDDITDPAQAAGWWPASRTGTGWVLATTRRRDPVLSGGGRRVVDIDVYREDEATSYLRQRLTMAGKPHLLDDRAAALAQALGWLPLALSHAAAYMIGQRVTCGAYLDLYTAGAGKLDELMPDDPDGHRHTPDGHTRSITVTLLLALDAADARAPAGLAWPAMDLAAVLDPAGHPEALWVTGAARAYLTTYCTRTTNEEAGSPPEPVTRRQARAALVQLDRYGLIILDEQAGHRAVRVHALTARAARETAPGRQAAAVRAAADAVLALWPDADHDQPGLTAVLRANTTILTTHAAHAGDALWTPDGGHPLLERAGLSLLAAGLHNPAITHWEHIISTAQRILGPDHPDTLSAEANLATSYWQAGRTGEAISIEEKVAAAAVRILGPEHPDTLTVQANLAASYQQAGRTGEAITMLEKLAAAAPRILGPEHPDTLSVQAYLAFSYRQAGRTGEAITMLEKVAAAAPRILGPEHPDTLSAQANLATSYRRAGRTGEAITMLEKVAAAAPRILGPEHPDTLSVESNLASSYWQAGRTGEAIRIEEKVAAGRVRILGPEHPGTLTAQANLAASYRQAGRTGEAIRIEEKVAAGRVRMLGPEHPDTLTAQANLAASCQQAGRTGEAITILEKVTADRVRILGPEHPDTLSVQANLAASYQQAGRTGEAITMLEKVAAAAPRILGPEHPDTLSVQANLASSYRQAGRTGEAISIGEKVTAAAVRILGPEHPDTLSVQGNLAFSYWQAGRTGEAISIGEKVTADRARILGPEHPHTQAAAEALREWKSQ